MHRKNFSRPARTEVGEGWGMDEIDFELNRAVTLIQLAIPNPLQWSGAASNLCALSLERIATEVQALMLRLR